MNKKMYIKNKEKNIQSKNDIYVLNTLINQQNYSPLSCQNRNSTLIDT